jgi:hypothetical protein
MNKHRALAVAGSLGLSAIALTDAITHGITGHGSVFADDSSHNSVILIGDAVHGLAYVGLALVLRGTGGDFRTYGRVVRGVRRLLVGAFAALAADMLGMAPLVVLTGGFEDSPLVGVDEAFATTAFLAMLLGTLALGIATLRRNELGLGGQVLRLMLPVLLLTVGLGFLAPDWAHPGYLETTTNFGIALIGVGVVTQAGRDGTRLARAAAAAS